MLFQVQRIPSPWNFGRFNFKFTHSRQMGLVEVYKVTELPKLALKEKSTLLFVYSVEWEEGWDLK